ncbi:MAG: nitric oxide reductase NorD protein [Sulfurimonas sp.]|jgi:nitric oxide reductase NorD protein|uniref:nitric oxide reductase activation protein NorD n=1 Tax=Sulfurimonas sp. TaxID=2022749 RepID=UPI0039E6282B
MLQYLEFEENIGKAWDKFLKKKTSKTYDESRVFFTDKSKQLKIFHHLLGGEKGKELQVTDKRFIDTSRSLLEKISDVGNAFYLAWQDEKALYLPTSIAIFPTKKENVMLYFWLIAMLSKVDTYRGSLLYKNISATKELIQKYEGFKNFYEKSSLALIEQNKELLFLKSLEMQDLRNIQFKDEINTYLFPLWIYPPLSKNNKYSDFDDEDTPLRGDEKSQLSETLKMKKQANQMDDKKETDGFLAFLPESMMSILEQVNVDRSEDDSLDEDALYNAQDLDEITLGRKKANLSARLKMDLDLEYDSKEEYPIGKGHYVNEWDYKKGSYLIHYACIKPYLVTNIEPLTLPFRLKKTVRKIQNELDLMELDRVKNNRLAYGDEINLDTWIDYKGLQNKSSHHQNFYESFEKKLRDMSTLILADVSLSTEAGITQDIRIIDMIKDGLIVFSEALEKLQDRFAIYSFSSLKNKNIRFEIIKNFREKYSDNTRGRIDAMKPGYYTRLGAAIRESSNILNKQPTQNKLLLIISDGKPNDVDRYDGRYGIEDTKKSIEDARKLGIIPFCITIDLEAKEYLPYLFGRTGYTLVKDSKNLPKAITEIYINLTK